MSILPASVRDHEAALRVFAHYAGLLNREGVTWWMDYGTLLGMAQTGGMIPWDSDIDIGAMESSLPTILGLEDELRRMRFAACYHKPGPSMFDSGDWFHVTAGRGNPNGVDTFFWHLAEDGLYHRRRYADIDQWKGREFPPERLFPLQCVDFEGLKVFAPADIEWFAEHRYGKAWRESVQTEDYVEHMKAQGRVS